MTKKELKETAIALGLTVPDGATVDDLREMIEKANSPDAPTLKRHKVGRGSTRRIGRAVAMIDAQMAEFIKEIDLQFYEADKDGNRVGEWEFVSKLREIRSDILGTVNAQLNPQPED